MSGRKCRLWLAIENGQKKVYSLTPLSAEAVGSEFVCGFQIVNRSEEPNPLYLVRVSLQGNVVCNCPAFAWDVRKGESPKAPPDQPPPSCKHCDALRASGVLPVSFVVLLAERTRLLDSAELRISQLMKNRDIEREAAIRNADSLRSTIADLERQLRTVTVPAPRRNRKAKAA